MSDFQEHLSRVSSASGRTTAAIARMFLVCGGPMTIKGLIRRFTNERREGPGGDPIYSGSGSADSIDEIAAQLPAGFETMTAWGDGDYRAAWTHDTERAIVTYCEGDTTIQTFTTRSQYDQASMNAAAFYDEY